VSERRRERPTRLRGAVRLDRQVAEVQLAVPPLDQMNPTAFGRVEGQIGHPGEGAAACLGEVGVRRTIQAQEPAVILEASARTLRIGWHRDTLVDLERAEAV
jgi:hypothetical protein